MRDRKKIVADVLGFAGIGMIGAGLWIYDPRVSLVVTGAILMALAIAIGRRSGDGL